MNNEIDKDDLRDFLKDLSKLSNKYKIKISGCGCCGSPNLTPSLSKKIKYEYSEDQPLTPVQIKD